MITVMNRIAESLGKFIRKFLHTVLSYLHFVWQLFKNVPGAFSNFHTTVEQMQHVGLTSIPVVVAASLATGAIMAWQLAYQFADIIPLMFVGMAVGKSVMVELCPILTAMVLAGRIGASMCSELGTMAVTEQLVPTLTVISIFIGIVGGYEVAHIYQDVSFAVFFYGVRMFYQNWDLVVGLIKATLYGYFIASYACFFGFTTHSGAEGVGKNTKATVVAGMTSILIGGFVLSKLLLL